MAHPLRRHTPEVPSGGDQRSMFCSRVVQRDTVCGGMQPLPVPPALTAQYTRLSTHVQGRQRYTHGCNLWERTVCSCTLHTLIQSMVEEGRVVPRNAVCVSIASSRAVEAPQPHPRVPLLRPMVSRKSEIGSGSSRDLALQPSAPWMLDPIVTHSPSATRSLPPIIYAESRRSTTLTVQDAATFSAYIITMLARRDAGVFQA